MKRLIIPVLIAFAGVAHAQDEDTTLPPIPALRFLVPCPRLVWVNGQATIQYVLEWEEPAHIDPRFADSMKVIDLRELLTEDHIYLSRHTGFLDSFESKYRRERVSRNEPALRIADSVWEARKRRDVVVLR